VIKVLWQLLMTVVEAVRLNHLAQFNLQVNR
jgi:hypothetical protein